MFLTVTLVTLFINGGSINTNILKNEISRSVDWTEISGTPDLSRPRGQIADRRVVM